MQFSGAGDDALLPQEEVFLPSDLVEAMDDLTSGPEASSTAPPTEGTTPGSTSGEPSEVALPEFDPRYREEFEGLLYLGYLTNEFSWMGHRFKIRTMTSGEYIEAGLAVRPYKDSIGESRAYVAAMVAGCLVLVDGRPLAIPITKDPSDSEFANRFRVILDSWFPWTIDKVYEEFLKLEARVEEILAAMGKALPSAPSIRG